MANLNIALSPYWKARFRPLMKPAFWASAGIFGLSMIVLVKMFLQPEQLLGKADDQRNVAVNQQADQQLSPENRAAAADVDDLSVLLKELDKNNTIDGSEVTITTQGSPGSKSSSGKSSANMPQASAAGQLPQLEVPDIRYGQFESLPLLNLNPAGSQTVSIGSGSGGFLGLNPLGNGGSMTLPAASNNNQNGTAQAPSALQSALDRYAPQAAGLSSTATESSTNSGSLSPTSLSPGSLSPSTLSPTTLSGMNSSVNSATAISGTTLPTTLNTSSTPLYSTTITNPTVLPSSSPRATVPTDNAFTQLLNPQISSPTVNPTTGQTFTPINSSITPVNPQSFTPTQSVSPSTYNPYSTTNTQTIYSTTIDPSAPVFPPAPGTPVYQPQTTTTGSSGYFVPSNVPGQTVGNGQIRTFANP